MRRQRRFLYYSTFCLRDGTIITALPVRKPLPKTIKREKLKIDKDGVCREWAFSEREFSHLPLEKRVHLQDVISNRLNTRRAIREMLLPQFAKLQEDLNEIRRQLDQIQQTIGKSGTDK